MWKNNLFDKNLRVGITILGIVTFLGITHIPEVLSRTNTYSEAEATEYQTTDTKSNSYEASIKSTQTILNCDLKMNSGKPIVVIKTNLPEDTVFTVSLKNDKFNYEGSEDAKVKNGELVVGPFSNGKDALFSGRYTVSIESYTYAAQPEEVKRVIGDNFCNFTGDLISVTDSKRYIAGNKAFNIDGKEYNKEEELAKENSWQRQDRLVGESVRRIYGEMKHNYSVCSSINEWISFSQKTDNELESLDTKTSDDMLRIGIGDMRQLLIQYTYALTGKGSQGDINYFEGEIEKEINYQ